MSRSSGWSIAAFSSILAALLAVGLAFVFLMARDQIADAKEETHVATQRAEASEAAETEARNQAASLDQELKKATSRIDILKQQVDLAGSKLISAEREAANLRQQVENEQFRGRELAGFDWGELKDFFPERRRVSLSVDFYAPEDLKKKFDLDIDLLEGYAKRSFNRLENVDLVVRDNTCDWHLAIVIEAQWDPPKGTPLWWTTADASLITKIRIPGTDRVTYAIVSRADPYLSAIPLTDKPAAYRDIESIFEEMAKTIQSQIKP
jgi:hypothetical protein